MADFPTSIADVPPFLHTWSNAFNGLQIRTVANAGAPAAITWTANTAVYMPFFLRWPYLVQRVFWWNGSTVSGNVDIGIYTSGGTQIWHQGSTAASGASLPQFVSTGLPLLLNPGPYLMAYVQSGTTSVTFGKIIAAAAGRIMGYRQQTTALPLPATATFASYNGVGIPLAGITNTASGF